MLNVCLEIQCDSKNYFGFVVDKFSGHRHVLDSCVITLLVTVSSRQSVQPSKKLGEFLRIPLPQIQNNFYNHFAFPNKHQILSTRFDENFCGNLVKNSYCRAFSLFETESGSQIKTVAILWYKLGQFVHCKSTITFRIAWLF